LSIDKLKAEREEGFWSKFHKLRPIMNCNVNVPNKKLLVTGYNYTGISQALGVYYINYFVKPTPVYYGG